jgi:hypothetical protein
VSTKVTNGKTCVMVLVYFTIKTEECMKANGGSIACKERGSSTTSLVS